MRKQKKREFNKFRERSYLNLFIFFAVLALFFFVINFNSKQVTGRISLDSMGIVYNVGEPIGGLLEFYLYGGELVPADSLVVVRIDSQTKEFLLSSLLSIDSASGNFYAQGANVQGNGKGYGIFGERIVNPEVEFKLAIKSRDEKFDEKVDVKPALNVSGKAKSSSGGSSGSTNVNDNVAPSSTDAGIDGGTSSPIDSPEPDSSIPSVPLAPFQPAQSHPTSITGASISGEEMIISGEAMKGKDFVYESEGIESAEIVSGSIKVNGESIDDSSLNIDLMKNKIVVSTDYSSVEKGFGRDFLTDSKSLVAQIDLIKFGLIAEENVDSVSISLYYNGEILTETEKKVYVVNSNETNKTLEEPILEPNITIVRVQSGAVLGKPVKWTQKIDFSDKEASKVVVNLPEYAENVEVSEVVKIGKDKSGSTADKVVVSSTKDGDSVEIIENEGGNVEISESANEGDTSSSSILTGEVTAKIKLDKEEGSFLVLFVSWVKDVFVKPTGFVVSDTTGFVVSDKKVNNNVVEITDNAGLEVVQEVTLEYETSAPYAVENTFVDKKEVTIFGPDVVHYIDVVSFTEIPESFDITNPEVVKVFWQNNGVYLEPTEVSDLDGNGIYDYVEWITPSLSNQTFIIEIVRAEHLDENKEFLSDIYDEVKSLDEIWSETISENHYVRIVFERNLTSENDITIYPRTVSGTPRIEIYEANGTNIVAEFFEITDNQYNKVFLTGLQGEQDTFDLHVLDGNVEFDHIIDPTDLSPNIQFVNPTPADLEAVNVNNIYINVSSSDDSSNYYVFTDFNSDLVLWTGMDDVNASGDTVDLSSYSNNGTKQGNAVQGSLGYFGSKFDFDGSGDYIAIGDKASVSAFDTTTPFTVSAWIKTADGSTSRQVVSDTTTGSVGWAMYYDSSSSNIKFEVNNGTTNSACTPESSITDNTWHFFYGRYNGSAVSCGLDGADSAAVVYAGTSFLNSVGVSIGSLNSASGVNSWNGSIDEVLMFSRALANPELDSLYNASATQYSNNFTSLSDGSTNIVTAYAVDTNAHKNQTETRTISVNLAFGVQDISTCATLGTANKVYNLTSNIVVSDLQAAPCISITAQNVTLLGNGFQIGKSTFEKSVIYSNQNFTNIRNIVLNRSAVLSATGEITLINASNSNITGVTFGPGNIGLVLQNVHNSHFDGNVFNTADRGVNTVTYSANNTFNYNFVNGTNYSLVLTGGNNTVLYTNLSNPDINALYITGSNNYFNDVRISNSVQSAIVIASGENNTFDSVDLNNTNISFYDIDFSASNKTNIINTKPRRYSSMDIGGIIRMFDSRKGEIQYLLEINGSGENLTNEVYIDVNLASVKSDVNPGLNRSANVTFYNMPANFTEPYILRDGKICSSDSCPNYTGLNEVTVKFKAPGFSNYSIGDLPVCTSLPACVEGSDCVIDRDCKLNNDSCSGEICQFDNLTFNADIYTGHNAEGDGKNLALNISGKVLFSSENGIIFSGKNVAGANGRNGGIINITMPPTGLFNRTNAVFEGSGGAALPLGQGPVHDGGNGGTLQINYHGLIGANSTWTVNVSGGTGTNVGAIGFVIQNKYLNCPRDADVDGDGVIAGADLILISSKYNNLSSDSGFSSYHDVNCDNKINVIEISRIGFEFFRGQ